MHMNLNLNWWKTRIRLPQICHKQSVSRFLTRLLANVQFKNIDMGNATRAVFVTSFRDKICFKL